ncbi:hypothetical protein [Knoellia subterranea]|uniref:Uncharacterized protein n=1 Tax=Knoellia subterranea KCTC 19937 TaxID=1385521 RepID=A0A0A0JU10_9MICO|nr:hypothetical protein [Knoellia subterranea]KGN39161.1 hypothetical protein N803_01240 [Knoellia subterranea KCTC 19937]
MTELQRAGNPGPGDIVGSVGEISFTPTAIHVPGQTIPMAGSTWIVRDQTRTERFLPTWAIVCAIVFFLACFLGLLFLAVKETRIVGYYEVEVTNGPRRYVTQIPATQTTLAHVRQNVDYARSLSTWAEQNGGSPA